jgi:hypothetical protein
MNALPAAPPFWGELHTHSAVSDGNGSMEDCFAIARSHLDFWALADHAYDPAVFSRDYRQLRPDHLLLHEEWPKLQDLCRRFEAPGRFVPFLAYEWTNFGYGHHNVYYLNYDEPIRMPPTLPQLYAALRGTEALVIPHHTGYSQGFCGKDWDHHDEQLSPFVELYSLHGSSEEPGGIRPLLTPGSWMGPGAAGGSVQEGLARGHKLGIMCSSDAHGDHPGAYDLGLIAAYAGELTRDALWDAFKARRVYGVTGDRILLDFSINGTAMGGVLRGAPRRHLDVAVQAWDRVERLDIIKNNAIWRSLAEPAGAPGAPGPPGADGGRLRLRFMVEWGFNQRRADEWRGELAVRGGRITAASPCYRGPVARRVGHGIADQTETACAWTSRSEAVQHGIPLRRFADAMWFEVECGPDARLHLTMAADDLRRELALAPDDILARDRLIFLEEVPFTTDGGTWGKMKTYAKFHVHRGWRVEQVTHHLRFEDGAPAAPGQTDFYYVRVIQRNGQRAWSSPVWVEA